MKRFILILTAALFAASSVQATTWFRTYGGSGYDEGHCVQQTLDGGYIVTGYTKSNTSEKAALWLLKTDSLGDTVWSKTYGATDSTEAVGNFVRQTQDGGYIVTGKLRKDVSRIWLLKTDGKGDTIWTRTYGEGHGSCVQEITSGGYILTGIRFYPRRLFLVRTDALGNAFWARDYILDGWVYSDGSFVDQLTEGGYIITGMVEYTEAENYRYAMCLIKTDSLGDTVWSYTKGGEEWLDEDCGQCVRQTRDGYYIVVGRFNNQAFLLKLDNQGDSLWTRTYGFSEAAACIEKKEKDEYALTGNASRIMVSSSNVNAGTSWLLSTNNQGDSLWTQTYGELGCFYLEETQDKGFIITGGNGDLVLLKTDSLGLLGIAENPIVETDNGWKVTHPIGNYIVLHYQGLPQGFRANVFDVSGRKVDEIRGDGIEGAMTWGINYPPGVYFIQALDNRNKQKTAKVVLVR